MKCVISKMNFSLTFLLVVVSFFAKGQNWNKLYGMSPNVTVKQLEIMENGIVYALTNEDYIFYSSDEGQSWHPITSPLENSIILLNVRDFHVNKESGKLFMGTSFHGVVSAIDNGEVWDQEFFSTDLVSGLHESVNVIASSNDTIVVSGNYSFGAALQRYFYSTDNGNSWSGPSQGIGIAEDILIDNSNWVVATGNGIQTSSDFGGFWNVLAFNNASIYDCRTIVKNSNGIYYCVLFNFNENEFEVYESSDLTNWDIVYSFASQYYYSGNLGALSESLLLATKEGLIKLSLESYEAELITDAQVNEALEIPTSGVVCYGSESVVGAVFGASPNYDWTSSSNGLQNTSFYPTDNYLFRNEVLFTTSSQSRIVGIKSDMISEFWDYSLPIDEFSNYTGNNIYLTQNEESIFTGNVHHIFKSTNEGQNWSTITTSDVFPLNSNGYHNIYYFNSCNNGDLYAAQLNDEGRLYRSSDNGNSWGTVFSDMDVTIPILKFTNVISDENNVVYATYYTAALQNKMIRSTDGGETWVDFSNPFLSSFNSDFEILMDNLNQVFVVPTREIFSIDDSGEMIEVDVPWNTVNSEIIGLDVEFDINNNLVVNVRGDEFCMECGVYRRNNGVWENLSTPNLLAPFTPVFGLELLYDSIPVVRTNFTFSEGAFDQMGYYYWGDEFVDVEENAALVDFMIYPNPAREVLAFTCSLNNADFKLFNAIGQEVLNGITSLSGKNKIDISGIGKGAYYLVVTSDSLSIARMVVKE